MPRVSDIDPKHLKDLDELFTSGLLVNAQRARDADTPGGVPHAVSLMLAPDLAEALVDYVAALKEERDQAVALVKKAIPLVQGAHRKRERLARAALRLLGRVVDNEGGVHEDDADVMEAKAAFEEAFRD